MSAKAPVPVTAIILTYNEAINIRQCIACLGIVDQVIVVDSGSKDDTVARARQVRGDVEIFEHPFADFGEQRNWALDYTEPRHEWILFIDADEFCTPELLDEVARFVANPGDRVGAYIAGRNYFIGRWLKHATMFPSHQLRLLKLGQVRYRKEGHGQKEVANGPLHYLKESWRHEAFSKGVAQWLDRHNRYSTEEAELLLRLRQEPIEWSDLWREHRVARRRVLKRLVSRLPGRPLIWFLYLYLFRRGFLDGYPGLLYCALVLANQTHTQAKIAEIRHRQAASGSRGRD